MRSFAALLMALCLVACGSVPRPFLHQEPSALLDDPRVTASIKVMPVAGAPALAPAMAKALLEADDLLATTGDAGSDAMILSGSLAGQAVTWRLGAQDGRSLGTVAQPLPQEGLGPERMRAFARAGADLIARKLRGADSGVVDLDAEPHVALHLVNVPPGIDSGLFTRAMAEALALQGIATRDDAAIAIIDGQLRVTPQGDKRDLVEITWRVRAPSGEEIGTITQGSPVDHIILIDQVGLLARQIAAAAAPGVGEAVRHAASSPTAKH